MKGAGRAADALSWALVAAGVATLLWRLSDLEQAPFINDEPQFLEAARAQLTTGHVLTRSTIIGTSGYYYGGAVFWFYGLLQLLAGPSALLALGAMAATVTASQAFFAVSLTRALTPDGGWAAVLTPAGRWVLGPLLVLLASSPHQHFWARLAWDQLTDASAFVAVGLLLTLRGRALWDAGLIGAILGFGLSSHPMIAPLAALLGLAVTVGPERPRTLRPALARAVTLGLAALVVLTPWLRELWAQRGAQGRFAHGAPLTLDRALEPFRGPGAWGIDYFFDGEWGSFLASPEGPWAWGVMGPLSRWGWVGLGLGGLLLGLRGERRRHAALGLAALLAYPLFFAVTGVPVQPHYQFPTGWIPLLGVGLLLAAPWPWLRAVTVALSLLLAGWQLDLIAGWRRWIAQREGTRGVHYAVTLREQRRVVAEICGHGQGPVVVALQIVAFSPSFSYLASTEPSCAGRALRWCGPDRGCSDPVPDETIAVVRYAEAEGARLSVGFSR